MASKFYAIKKGENLQTGESVSNIIVTSWNECLQYVKGVKGAIYKSFLSKEEAMNYLNSNNSLKKGEDIYPEDIPHIYVDGSYNIATGEYGYGVVVILNNEIIHVEYGGGKDKECNQRQVNGELRAAIEGVKYSVKEGYNHVVMFYDYAGVCNHATGNWERNNSLSSRYFKAMQDFMKEDNIKITFVKVDSHTNDLYNDIADELAKLGAQVSFVSVVDKALKNKTIQVTSEEVKLTLSKIIKVNVKHITYKNEYVAIDSTNDNTVNEPEKSLESEIQGIIKHIKELEEDKRLKYIKSLKKDIQTQIILKLI